MPPGMDGGYKPVKTPSIRGMGKRGGLHCWKSVIFDEGFKRALTADQES